MPRLASNGIEIEYEEFGRPSDPTILLVMGLGAQMVLWHPEFCAALVAQGYRVIRFDNRDVGKSTWFDHLGVPDVLSTITAAFSKQPLPPAPYYLRDMAADAAGLLEGLGIDQAHVVGASMGGMIAQTLAIEHPQRVASLTSIMSTTGNADLPPPEPQAMEVLLTPVPEDREGAIERSVTTFRKIGSPGLIEESEIRRLAAEAWDRGVNPTGPMRQLTAILSSGDRTEALRKLKVPSLVIHGKVDPLVPFACGEATAAAIPGARLLAIEGMGHDMPRSLWPTLVESITELARQSA